MSEELFQTVAFHESGHAIIGYYMGYQIDDIKLLIEEPGTGWTKINYGEDTLIITGILNAIEVPDFFNSLSQEIRSRTPEVTTKLCCILVAGAIAEAIHKEGIEYKGVLKIGFADPDDKGINACEYVMTIIDKPNSAQYVTGLINAITSILRSNENWQVLKSLAQSLLNSTNKTLLKKEIEAIFETHNFKPMKAI